MLRRWKPPAWLVAQSRPSPHRRFRDTCICPKGGRSPGKRLVTRVCEALGLTLDAKGLPACWNQHPIAVHEITGLFLAWTALLQALTPAQNPDPFSPTVVPGPRDYLDLSTANAAAGERATAADAACAQAGHHVRGT